MNILIVGAGFAGAVAARELAEAGHIITVIDERPHIAGNAYDYVNEYGIRVHKYGPHIWHTNNDEAQEWFSKFTDWIPYQHKVMAVLENGVKVPLPINRETINEALGLNLKTNEEAEAFLERERVKIEDTNISNSEQAMHSAVGKRLSDIFFAPYTKKMWGLELKELSASVAGRIPTKLSDDALYFPKDKYQGMPKEGYTKAFEKILTHPNISVHLLIEFSPAMEGDYDYVFNSMPIDGYFEERFGKLPYRSIKFNTVTVPNDSLFPVPTVNFTTTDKWTRVTEWKKYPGHGECNGFTTLTYEQPCDYLKNNEERYYPVKDVEGKYKRNYSQYEQYAKENKPNMTFIGRCGTYQYLDMWMVICQTLKIVRDFKEKNK